jgi:hypothetical protein
MLRTAHHVRWIHIDYVAHHEPVKEHAYGGEVLPLPARPSGASGAMISVKAEDVGVSDIDGSHLNIVELELPEPIEARVARRHEENVPVPLVSCRQLS